jgi:hypothetical protein
MTQDNPHLLVGPIGELNRLRAAGRTSPAKQIRNGMVGPRQWSRPSAGIAAGEHILAAAKEAR